MFVLLWPRTGRLFLRRAHLVAATVVELTRRFRSGSFPRSRRGLFRGRRTLRMSKGRRRGRKGRPANAFEGCVSCSSARMQDNLDTWEPIRAHTTGLGLPTVRIPFFFPWGAVDGHPKGCSLQASTLATTSSAGSEPSTIHWTTVCFHFFATCLYTRRGYLDDAMSTCFGFGHEERPPTQVVCLSIHSCTKWNLGDIFAFILGQNDSRS